MDENNRNFLLAAVLSICVLVLWQAFYAGPKMKEEQARKQREAQKTQQTVTAPTKPGAPGISAPSQPKGTSVLPQPGATLKVGKDRKAVLKASPRVEINTPKLRGSISLKGGRIDDLVLKDYKVSTKDDSENVTLFSPADSPEPYFAEYGWVTDTGSAIKPPTPETVWQVKSSRPLSPSRPVTLTYDNGEGLVFLRTISVDDNYMFTVKQSVENKSSKPVTLYPYARIWRGQQPKIQGFFILHEGFVGVLGEESLQEVDYDDAIEKKTLTYKQTKGGWLGITDKYWAAVLIPDQNVIYDGAFSDPDTTAKEDFQAHYIARSVEVPANGKAEFNGRLFAGAKLTHLVDSYEKDLKIEKFELLIDWGWFHFLTKPLFYALDYFYKLVGNFGVAILIVTVLIKLALFWFANKSYVSMSKMKKLQPEMQRIRERFPDDKVRQQQALMEMYKKEKVNPMSGCLPILIQIPVFFALYKVLFVTIEMRHAPFFGWIQDLSAPDPTSMFNIFGLIPWDPPSFLQIGVWPILMGITMWVQMKLNPQQPDPIQQKIFTWMPVFFTFLLAPFPAGLVIYWAWNNLLSIIQQWVIMKRQGVKVDLLDNTGFNKLKEFGISKLKAINKLKAGGSGKT